MSPGELSGLALVPVGGVASPQPFTLHVVAASIEGGNQAASTADIAVTVTPGQNEQSGHVADGYVAGATVFADANGNGHLDAGEVSTTTNADGSFTLVGGSGPLVMFGGTDISTGLSFDGVMTAPEGSTVVTPLTTLISALVSTGVSAADAASQVAAAFGLGSAGSPIDLTTFDPVSQAVAGNPDATAVLSAGIQVQSTITQIAAAGGSADAAVSAIAGAVVSSTSTSTQLDLSTPDTVQAIVTNLVTNSQLSSAAADSVVSVVVTSNEAIQSATDLTTLAQAGQVAQGAAADQLASTDFSDPNQVQALQTFVADIPNQVSNAQVGAVNGAVLGTAGNDVLTGTAGNDSIDGLDGNDQINGGAGNDFLFGGAGNDRIDGGAGSDHIDGGAGFDRAVYTDATSGIVANLAAGTVTTGSDTDTITAIEGIVGSNFDDTLNGAGFTGSSGIAGSPIGFSEFEGGAGNDTIIGGVNALGAALTRVSYVSATAGVTVDLAAGTADGDGSVGHDTLIGPMLAVWGSGHDDTLRGSNNGFGTVEVFSGFAGNDLIDGRGGFDRADYNNDPTTTSGITVNLAAGTVTGDASVGTDTLRSVEAVRGTNFADTYDATGFSGASTNAGSFGTFNEFTGNGGDDTIIGNGNTRISYVNATAGVTVDIQAGTADGDGSVGHDTFSGVNAVQVSMFADTLLGSALNETFTGNGGDDYIDGRGGFDTASYNNIYLATGGITVNLAAGTVTGDSSIGTDTLRSIEGIQGTNNADVFDATGYGSAGALNVGNNFFFNTFEGLGGDDTITGNGSTRILYTNAAAGVTVDLSAGTAHGTATGDVANVGTDTITGGVNSVQGSAFGDVLVGNSQSNTLIGGGGNDTIDGGAGGDIAVFSGVRSAYSLTFNAGQVQVADSVVGRDGTDTLTNVEVAQFSNVNLLIASGSSGSPVDLSDGGLFFNAPGNALIAATGSNNDFVKIGFNLSNHPIDLGAGSNDTVLLGPAGGYTLNLANVENVVGSGGNDFVTLANDANGLSVDLGAGTDNLNLANGANSISVNNVENILGTDFSGSSDDTLTLLNDVSGVSVNLANGTNTLNLAGGSNTLANVFNVQHVNGTASDDVLTITGGIGTPSGSPVVDMGAGDDTLNIGSQFVNLTLQNVEHLNGNSQDNFFSLSNDVNGLSVDLGAGNDTLALANGFNAISVANVENVNGSDFGSASPSDDTLKLLNDVNGLTVNLGEGTNTLNLAAGGNTLANAFGVQAINGSASDDTLTFQNQVGGVTIDLGGGNNTLNLGSGFNDVTVDNVQTVNGGAGNDNITIGASSGTTTVTGGLGYDVITAGAGPLVVRFTSVADSSTGQSDQVIGFDASQDKFSFDHISGGPDGLTGQIAFIGSNAFDGTSTAHVSEARFQDSGGGNGILQIDVNGDGVMDAHDIEINLTNMHGTLSSANFVVPDQAPTDIILAGNTVAENSANGTVVGTLSAVDPDTGDTASFSLTNDAGGLFAINGNQLVVAGPLDYETASSEQVTVRVTDSGGLTFDKSFTIGVTNVNEAPTDISLSGNTVAENSANGTVVGALSALDPDAGDTATFSLINNAGGLFAINGNQLVVAGPLDYETATSEQVTVRATDSGGLTHDKTFTIGVTNVNEAPTNILLSSNTVAENSANGTVVGTLSALDPDAGDTATFSLVSNAGGLFAINGNQLVVNGPLNYEAASSEQVTIRVTDSGSLTYDKAFTIGVTNVNEAPTDISLSNATVNAASANGAVVGALSAIDPDVGDHVTFSLTNNDGGLFGLDANNNLIVTGSLANVTSATQQVTVRATDAGGLSLDKSFTLTVTGITAGGTFNGTSGDDVLNGTPGNDVFQGFAGNDTLNGNDGQDSALYSDATAGITVNMAAGTVSASDGSVGNDTLRSIESVQGSNFNDTYDATGYWTGVGAVSANQGTPSVAGGVNNSFEGLGGNDTITGNGRTTVSYFHALGGVTVNLSTGANLSTNGSAFSTAANDAAGIGTDTLINVNWVRGSEFGDILNGGTGNDVFVGGAGNDSINGGAGFDLVNYTPAIGNNVTGGISVNMTTGVVTGDASVGTDTLRSIESVRGTNFADSYNATGFGSGANVGNNGTFNEFEGMGGNDTIVGNNNTRILYYNSTGAVTVDLAAGTADGDASVGHDTISGIAQVRGSSFDDHLYGSNRTDITEVFDGWAGNDYIDGRGGFDQVQYNNNGLQTSGIHIDMTAGIVTGVVRGVQTLTPTFDGVTTLRGIEQVFGSNAADTYDATNFGLPGFVDPNNNNVGNNGTFNSFQGMGGNDTIIGNGNTQILYSNATAGVTVTMTSTGAGTASGNGSVGTDTFTGVNNVLGSNFADTITGSDGNEVLGGGGGDDVINGGAGNDVITGGAGNDTIDGGAGGDVAVFSGVRSAYNITFNSPGAGQIQVADTVAGRDGTDTLTNVEVAQFSDQIDLLSSGTASSPVDISGIFIGGTSTLTTLTGSADDYLAIGPGVAAHPIDLGAGNDTIILGQAGGYTLNLANVENVLGSSGNDFLTLSHDASGLSIDLGAGSDNLNLANGVNSISVHNVENIFGSDFSGSSDDMLTLLNDVSGVSVNLANGNNTLNLAAGANSLVDVFNVQHINGTASDDVLTITDGLGTSDNNPIIDLGAGNDTLNFGSQFLTLTALNVEHIVGNSQDNFLVLHNDLSGVSVDLGAGNDTIGLANGVNSLSVFNVENIDGSDFGGTNPSNDTLTLLNDVNGVTVNLGDGTNTLNLFDGSNTFANLFNVQTVNGSASDDTLTLQNQVGGVTVDLGAGNDTLNLANGFNSVTVNNVETVNGGSGNDTIVIANASGTTTVTGGQGFDVMTASAGHDVFNFGSVADSQFGSGDQIINFDAANDSFEFSGMSGSFASAITYVDTAPFDGGGHSEAHLANIGGQTVLQIDVNGDGVMTSADMEIQLVNLSGTLHSSNFIQL